MTDPALRTEPSPITSSTVSVHDIDIRLLDLRTNSDAATSGDHGRAFLLLHGGAGPSTMTGLADALAERTRARVLLPTHPGFGGTPRAARLATTRDLAALYACLLDQLGLEDVTLVGNSFGGWLAAEMALSGSPRIRAAVIVDGIGIEVEGHPLTDVSGLSPAELRSLSFHDPGKAPQPPAGAGRGPSADVAALIGYAGPTMSDPTLGDRLGGLSLPVHVVWGDSDGIVDTAYGRAYAAAVPRSRFTVLAETGHLPQLESPEALLDAILDGHDRPGR